MDTRAYLGQIRRLDTMIKNKFSEIYALKAMACSVTAPLDGDRVQTSSDKDKMGSAVAKIVDLEGETKAIIDDYISKRQGIIRQIDSMRNTDYYTVLYSRYVSYKPFEEIADDIGRTKRQAQRIHDNAILEFERQYGDEYKDL